MQLLQHSLLLLLLPPTLLLLPCLCMTALFQPATAAARVTPATAAHEAAAAAAAAAVAAASSTASWLTAVRPRVRSPASSSRLASSAAAADKVKASAGHATAAAAKPAAVAAGGPEAAASSHPEEDEADINPEDYPFVAPPLNLVIEEALVQQQQQQQQQQQRRRVAAYAARFPRPRSSSSSSSSRKRLFVASELLQDDEPDLVVQGEEGDDNFEVYADLSLKERIPQEPSEVFTDLLEYEKLYRGIGPWPSAPTGCKEKGIPYRKSIRTIAEAMAEEEKWIAREEQPPHEWVLDEEEEELLEPRVRRIYRNMKSHYNPDTRERFARFAGEGFVPAKGPLPLLELNQKPPPLSEANSLFFLDASYAFASPPSPSTADMGQFDDPLDAQWRRRGEEVIRQVIAYGWPPKVRRAFSGFTLLDCSWEQQRLLLPLQAHAYSPQQQQQQQQQQSIVTAQDLRRLLQMIKHRLQDLSDLECLPLLDAFDIQVAAVPPGLAKNQQQQQQLEQFRAELIGRRELTLAAGSWVYIHYESAEAAAATLRLPPDAAAAAVAACARMHAATAAGEGAAPGKSLLQQLLQERQQPLPPITEEDARDYIRPMGSCEVGDAVAAERAAAAAAAPSYAVAAAANRLSPKEAAPSLSFLQRAVKASRRHAQQQHKQQQGQQQQQQWHAQQACVLLGSPNAVCLFFARDGQIQFVQDAHLARQRHLAGFLTSSPNHLLSPQVVRAPPAAASAAAAAAAAAARAAPDPDGGPPAIEPAAAAAIMTHADALYTPEAEAAAAGEPAAAAAATADTAAAEAAFAALPLAGGDEAAAPAEDWLDADEALEE
ncbi:hypothetical protein Efla_007034 [Eimeria flavescens]